MRNHTRIVLGIGRGARRIGLAVLLLLVSTGSRTRRRSSTVIPPNNGAASVWGRRTTTAARSPTTWGRLTWTLARDPALEEIMYAVDSYKDAFEGLATVSLKMGATRIPAIPTAKNA